MATSTPTENLVPATPSRKSTPLRCFIGALISASLAIALYSLTASITHAFAAQPLPRGSVATANIAVAVRTLVVGMSTLGTTIFAISTLGLLALGIQLVILNLRSGAKLDESA
ncbi:MAG: DUF3082 domain-containing protein [Timaviella obliquedivisa GSE-PSE-MK23-08B]|nr:DUF3082 domain-containing protein [Timaviella obliquedivisa GSE-PSE-MK23-08B]